MPFAILDALCEASIAAVAAYFVLFTAMGAAGRIKGLGRALSVWLMILSILIVVAGVYRATIAPIILRRELGPNFLNNQNQTQRFGPRNPYSPGRRLNPPPQWRFLPPANNGAGQAPAPQGGRAGASVS